MKTIEVKSGGQLAQFTTKSVTVGGREFFYSKMANVSHNPEACFYTFTYDNQQQLLPYEAKDVKVLNAIFSQVQSLQEKKAAAQAASVPETAGDTSSAPAEAAAGNLSETAPAPEPEAAPAAAEVAAQEAIPQVDSQQADMQADALQAAAAEHFAEHDAEAAPEIDAAQKARRKKSLITFLIIVAAVAALTVIGYFVFGIGNNDNPPADSQVTESQQYDDIDQLIDDLQ